MGGNKKNTFTLSTIFSTRYTDETGLKKLKHNLQKLQTAYYMLLQLHAHPLNHMEPK